MTKLARLIPILIVLALLVSACAVTLTPEAPSMANPASVHCIDKGGTSEIREGDDGGQYGVCIFEDGSECDEWAFFRDECKPGGLK